MGLEPLLLSLQEIARGNAIKHKVGQTLIPGTTALTTEHAIQGRLMQAHHAPPWVFVRTWPEIEFGNVRAGSSPCAVNSASPRQSLL